MNLHQDATSNVLGQTSFTNRGWHTWEVERGASNYAIGAYGKHKVVDDLVAHEVSQQRTSLLMK